MNSVKLRMRYTAVAVIICLLMACVCAYSIYKTSRTAAVASVVQVHTKNIATMMAKIRGNTTSLKYAVTLMAISSDQESFDSAREVYTQSMASMSGVVGEYRNLGGSDMAADLENLGHAIDELDRDVKENYLKAVSAGNAQEIQNFLNSSMPKHAKNIGEIAKNIERAGSIMTNTDFNNLQSSSSMTWVVFWMAVVFLVSLSVMGLVTGSLANRVEFLTSRCKRIADGELTVTVDNAKGADEVGDLAKAIAYVVTRQHGTVSQTSSVSDEFYESAHRSGSYAKTISAAASSVVSQSMAVSAASDQLVSTTNDIADSCRNAAENSEEARLATVGGMEAVKDTVAKIRQQSVRNNEDSAAVFSLGQKIQRIDTVVTTIQEIAEQTNLLALNAAIEAARAGEHGRGFAVVADEVRALAGRTTQSTQEIVEMVKAIHDEAEHATNSMSSSVKSMDAVADQAQTLESTLSAILEKVNHVNGQINEIARASEQQSSTTADISNNMQHITELVQGIANQANSQADISSTLEQIAKNMKKSCDSFHL
ncbi:MAG: methyl-accepting chemotaxis protein [Succinivibrionaceae bacterium]|nr:methyl-accepting chemotaxis protein [Succinivibrionaceae bacterium]